MLIKLRLLATLFFIPFFANPLQAEESAVVHLRTITTAAAAQVALAAIKDCTEKGFKVAVAVSGRDGHLLAFLRNPLAGPHTIAISKNKAYTAASFQASSAVEGVAKDLQFAPNISLLQGGMPMQAGGHFYGGVGVSGATSEVDEECALAGIASISDELEFAE